MTTICASSRSAAAGRRARRLAAALGLVLAAAAGCGRDPRPDAFELTDIAGAPFGRELALTDHEGRARTLADFRGKAVAVFFGYTSCPDVCPTVLAELAQVMRELGPLAAEVQGLFVAVDPDRDTPQALARYVGAFHPAFSRCTATPRRSRARPRSSGSTNTSSRSRGGATPWTTARESSSTTARGGRGSSPSTGATGERSRAICGGCFPPRPGRPWW